MNKLQKEIKEVEKKEGKKAYLKSVIELGFDPSKSLSQLRKEGKI
jgi:hypothetical protein